MRKYFKVTFENGDTISTWMNGIEEEIIQHYSGFINIGKVTDNFQRATEIEFIETNHWYIK